MHWLTHKIGECGTSLNCSRCQTADVTGVVRSHVELDVDDGKDSATFVVFDKEMTKLTKQEASVLALEEGSNSGEEELPSCLEELTGKEFVFQIRVTPFNFTPNHRTFMVSTITNATILEKPTKVVLLSTVVRVQAVKMKLEWQQHLLDLLLRRENIGGRCGTTDRPEMSGAQTNRKRRHE
ncbi:hypothetical protein N665_0531s0010 [Sinapis alba]|nr:hypothetical protein N665_0531s0010 [Sinapis alba]